MKNKSNQKSRRVTRILVGIVSVATFISIVALVPKAEEAAAPASQLLGVKVAQPIQETITEWDEYTGRFEASERVEVRARVSGYVESVRFKAGQAVNKGEVLFIIDQRPFKIALNDANARLEQAKSELQIAEDNFKRVQPLKATGAVSLEEYDRRQQAVTSAKARIGVAKAAVDNARLNLQFTRVTAPISGRIGRDLVNPGNLISGGSANSTLLSTIVATSPIHFYFNGSEADLLKYSRLNQNGERGSSRNTPNPVLVKLLDETDFVHEGQMDFMDNEIDRSTGSIEGRAIFANEDGLLEAGMFGRARLLGQAPHEVIMIPDEIIGANQNIRYVYVLDENDAVTYRPIKLGPLHTNGLRIVRGGLTATDQLIINNIQKIRPGVQVAPQASEIQINE